MVDRRLSWLGHPGQDFADGAFSERPAASSPRNRRPRTAFVSRLPADFDGLSRLFRSAFHDLDLMKRRAFFLNATGGFIVGTPLFAAVKRDGLEAAAEILKAATASGQIEAQRTAALALSSAGEVAEVNVTIGDSVVAGQPLLKLNTVELERSVISAQQSLAIQEANLATLLAPASEADITAAEANVASAQASLQDLLDGPSEDEITAILES